MTKKKRRKIVVHSKFWKERSKNKGGEGGGVGKKEVTKIKQDKEGITKITNALYMQTILYIIYVIYIIYIKYINSCTRFIGYRKQNRIPIRAIFVYVKYKHTRIHTQSHTHTHRSYISRSLRFYKTK